MMFPRFTRIALSSFVFALLCAQLQAQSFTLHTDIGSVGVAGSMTYSSATSTYTVKGAGLDIGGNADAFHFGYLNLSGDGQIIAKVNTAPNTTANTKVGIMIRDALSSGSKHSALLINPATGILYLSRASANGTTTSTLAAGRVAPYWLKLIRVGTLINGYVSVDGTAWQWVTSSTVSMTSQVSFGMAVSSGSTSTLTTATFTNVSAIAGTVTDATAPNAPTGITLLGKSDTSATIGWNPAIDDVGVSGYDVYRGATLAGSTNGLTFRLTDTALAHSTSYSYTVKARDRASKTSVASTALSVTTDPRGNPVPWVNKDVGTVGLAGSGTSSGGVFTVKGSGYGAGTTVDAFHFTYQPVSGDCEIRSRIPSISNGSYGSTVGVMIRDGLGAGDRYAMMYVVPTGEIGYAFRAVAGSALDYGATGTDLLPAWMKVKRIGNDFFFYQSATDGTTWTLVKRAPLALATNTNVGFVVGSGNDPALTTVTFDTAAVTVGAITDTQAPAAPVNLAVDSQSDVSVRLSWADGGDNVGVTKYQVYRGGTMIATVNDGHYVDNALTPSQTYSYTVRALDAANNVSVDSGALVVTANPGSLPIPWWHTEIGDVGVIGSADLSAGAFNLQGSGSDIWGTNDTFHFVYQPLSGDGEILARVATQQNTSPSALTGLMIRENLSDTSRYAFVLVSPSTWSEFDYRTAPGGSAGSTGAINAISLPYWLKLVRMGNTFSAFRSPDGSAWTALGSSQTIAMNTDTYIGLAVASNDNSVLGSVSMTDVTLQVDNDHDGLNDPWEIQFFGNLDQSPSGDPDGDGLSNLQEYQNGTNPTDYFNGIAPILEIVSGDNQSAAPDTFLPQPLVVRVKTGAGGALPNAPVTFHVESGGGQLGIDNIDTVPDPYLMRTDAAGLAAIYFKEPINGSGESMISAACSTPGQTVSVGFSAFVSSLALSPAGLSVQLTAGETRDETLILSNTGGATSSFCLDPPGTTYRYLDSDHTGGPVYGWSDISSTGTLLAQASNADTSYEGFSLTFSFPYFDQSFTEVFVSSNGFLTFGGGSAQADNYELPRVDMPSNEIAPFHVDLNPGESGDIFYLNEATRTIVQFENVARRDSVGNVTFQVILNDDGTIQFLYKNLPTVSDDVTVGLQNGTRDEGLTISYGSAYLHPGLAIEIYPSSGNSKWFGVSPTEGSAVPGVPQTISVHFDATSLATGVYSGVLELGTDCISLPLEAIPITMTVAKSPDDDGDGLPDDWEMQYFGNLGQTAEGDFDGDGVSNLIEFQQGRDPSKGAIADAGSVNLEVFTPFE